MKLYVFNHGQFISYLQKDQNYNYNYKPDCIKKLLSVNAMPYRTLLIARLNDLKDSAHVASQERLFHSVAPL